MMRRVRSRQWLLVAMLGLLIGLAAPFNPTLAQNASPVATPVLAAENESTLAFPGGIDVTSTLQWDGEREGLRLDLLYGTVADETITLVSSRHLDSAIGRSWTESAHIDLQGHYVPVGVDISWWWRLSNADGIVGESVPEIARWYDDRWDWKTIQTEQVVLHEYDLSDDFAQTVLETVQDTITDLEHSYGIEASETVSVWVYASNTDFQIAKPPNSRETIAALSYPDMNLIAAILPEGDDAELLRVLPHEVSHHVLAQATENPYSRVPLWFDEGMATHVQTGGTDGYMEMVTRARDDGRLFDLNSLTASFPYQAQQATLGYAASWSAIAYLTETYGDDGIARLIAAFAEGIPYDASIQKALGIDSDTLNTDWTNWVAAQ